MNRRRTLAVIRETLLSQPFSSRLPHHAIELVENTPPPFFVVKYVMSARTWKSIVPPIIGKLKKISSPTCG